jgi:DNA polymerase
VFGVGDIHSALMFVGEAPGADEDVQGEPFVGAAGQLLTRIIQTMGLGRETVYIGNILKCRPDTWAGERQPQTDGGRNEDLHSVPALADRHHPAQGFGRLGRDGH